MLVMKQGDRAWLLGLIALVGSVSCPIASAEQAPATAPAAQPAISDAKRALIKELLDVTGAKKMASDITNAMLQQMEQSYPAMVSQLLPEVKNAGTEAMMESRTRFSKRFRELYTQRIDLGQVVDEIYYPLYEKYFSEAELKDLISFYRSPTGTKALSVMPSLVRESMQRSSQLLNPQIMQLVREILQEEKAHLTAPQTSSPESATKAPDAAVKPAESSAKPPVPAAEPKTEAAR